MLSGYIYLLEVIEEKCSLFGFRYIGQHFRTDEDDGYFSSGSIVDNIIKQHGKEAFKRVILIDNIDNVSLLNELEIHYIQLYNTYKYTSNNGINLTRGGSGTKGMKCSQETKEKISKTNKGRLAPNKGIEHTTETKRKISIKAVGRIASEETRKKMSESGKGRITSEETRLKISAANTGKIRTEETKKKLSIYRTGKRHTAEFKLDMSKRQRKIILQYDLEENFIREWESIKEASEVLNIDGGDISKCCNNKKEKAGKFKWKFKNKQINNKKMIVEGNEGTEFIKDFYTGKTNVKLLVINPTAQEKVDILGWSKKPENEPVYTGEKEGVKTARIEMNVETKEGIKFQHSFFVENSTVVSKDGQKTQFVNEFGGFAYLPNDGSIPENMAWYNTNNLRKAFKGEEPVVDFLKKWLDVRKGQKLAFSNFEAMFGGNFSEIKSLLSKNSIGVWVGVKQTFTDSGESKYTQVMYPKYFVAQYVSGEDKPNPKGGVYKGWINGFTEALEGTRNAGGHLNIQYGAAPYTFTKVADVTKLPWLAGDNAATTGQKVEQPAF